jgi:hypothetical protein
LSRREDRAQHGDRAIPHSEGRPSAVAGPAGVNNWPVEETDNPLYADDRNFYKVEE